MAEHKGVASLGGGCRGS